MEKLNQLRYFISELKIYKEEIKDIYMRFKIELPDTNNISESYIKFNVDGSKTHNQRENDRSFNDLKYYYSNKYIVNIENTRRIALYILEDGKQNFKFITCNPGKEKVNIFNFKRKSLEFKNLILEVRFLSIYLYNYLISKYGKKIFENINRYEPTTYFPTTMQWTNERYYSRNFSSESIFNSKIALSVLGIIILLIIQYVLITNNSNNSINYAINTDEYYVAVDVTFQSDQTKNDLVETMEERGYKLVRKYPIFRLKRVTRTYYDFKKLE